MEKAILQDLDDIKSAVERVCARPLGAQDGEARPVDGEEP